MTTAAAPPAPIDDETLMATLRDVFGFGAFRPLQREIVSDALAGRDVLALLPTGGGKSLCYQLPALLRPGLTLVVSPLIALMKDQVDALVANGVAATYLNSSLEPGEARERIREIAQGSIRLLYLAPERIVMPGFLDELAQWDVRMVAIDEAHCISEWGHDFRPDYRRLVEIRERVPGASFIAFTATANERVRHDIVEQLRLRSPSRYVASFNRPNLTYQVVPKQQPSAQVLDIVRRHHGESGIVYCHSRRQTAELAASLRQAGVAARCYHAGLEHEERAAAQEAFVRDEAQVVCATIAFGMGIDKPDVRFVVHHDLPKNVEGYYQETGRAGRDGLPSECVLLYGAADVAKFARFIDDKSDAAEQAVARQQLREIVDFAEGTGCRRRALLEYFGEQWPHERCDSCDNCVSPREQFDGTVEAQKLLSCVYRIRQHGGFAVGLTHVVEVLTGADTQKVRRWGHHELSTYGVGSDRPRQEWLALARELIRLGLLRTSGSFNTVELTGEGVDVLTQRRPVALTVPYRTSGGRTARRSSKKGTIECDEQLFDQLRALRKRLADERSVPAYVVFSDVSLREMARDMPGDAEQLSRVSGVGAKKLAEFGDLFLSAIADYRRAAEPA